LIWCYLCQWVQTGPGLGSGSCWSNIISDLYGYIVLDWYQSMCTVQYFHSLW